MLAAMQPALTAMVIVAVLLVALLITLLLLWHRAMRKLRDGAARFAQGDLSQRLELHFPLQMSAVAESMNQMARQLDDRLQTLLDQRNETQAVLRSMVEGVVVIDLDERIKSLNRAASRLLGVSSEEAIGRHVVEVVRDMSLQRFITKVLAIGEPIEDELALHVMDAGPPSSPRLAERLLEVQGGAMRDVSGKRIGAVIVLHDVTRLRRLESVRRDFVANVSHEIKTPVTAIKAAVETMLEVPDASPDDAQRFLRMVARQADRLQAIIEDLLSLARIEQDSDNNRIEVADRAVLPMLNAAAETCHASASAKSVRIEVACAADLRGMINAPLLEQAVTNLLDNAIKYSPRDRQVVVRGWSSDGELVLEVEDHGAGIAEDHLPRLFERFYRTDKARSRALGGTGLGLAIVKHIAQAHAGHVSVESELGSGSTFRIHIPTVREPGPGLAQPGEISTEAGAKNHAEADQMGDGFGRTGRSAPGESESDTASSEPSHGDENAGLSKAG